MQVNGHTEYYELIERRKGDFWVKVAVGLCTGLALFVFAQGITALIWASKMDERMKVTETAVASLELNGGRQFPAVLQRMTSMEASINRLVFRVDALSDKVDGEQRRFVK